MFIALESLSDKVDQAVDEITENNAQLSMDFEDDSEMETALEALDDDATSFEDLDAPAAALENLLALRDTIATHGMSTSLLAYADADGYLASKSLVPAFESFNGTYKPDSQNSTAALEALGETIKEGVTNFVKKAWDVITGFVGKITGVIKALLAKFTGLFKKVEAGSGEAEHSVSPAAVGAAIATVVAVVGVVAAICKLPVPKQVAAAKTYRAKVVAYVKNVKIAKPLKAQFKALKTNVAGKATAAKDFVKGKAVWTKNAVVDAFKKVIALFKDGGAVNGAVKSAYRWASEAFKSVRTNIGIGARAVFGAVKSAATWIVRLLWGAVRGVATFVWSTLKVVGNQIAKGGVAVSKAARGAAQDVRAGIQTAKASARLRRAGL